MKHKLALHPPQKILCEVGRIITMFSAVEYKLSYLIYLLLGVTHKQGRLAVREPRAIERLELIRDLIALRGIKTDKKDIAELSVRIKEAQRERDHLAHTIWIKDKSTRKYFSRLTKGNWKNVPKALKDDIRKNRKVTPELRAPIDFKDLTKKLLEIHDMLDQIGFNIEEMLASSKKKSP